jgi:ribose transport system ATP-binding protein
VALLPRGAQQIVEIAKGLLKDARIVILDEPTASLTDQDTARLFDLLRRLRNEGRTIVYITHRIREVFEIGDRVSVLRDGRYVGTVEVGTSTEGALIEMMTGRSVEAIYPEISWRPQEVCLRLDSLHSRKLKDVTMELRRGEVVGIAGLLGSGKSEVGRACVGLEPLLSGRVVVKGEVFWPNPREALRRGIVYYPPDRRREGLVPPRPVFENVTLGALRDAGLTRGGLIRRGSEQSRVAGIRDLISIRTPDLRRPVLFLSGGNQQKVVLSRAFLRDADVHIFDEPTVGVDVPTRIEIYNYIRRLCERGAGILLISSDLPEVLHLSHRVYVMHDGEVRAELVGEGISEEAVLSRFFG